MTSRSSRPPTPRPTARPWHRTARRDPARRRSPRCAHQSRCADRPTPPTRRTTPQDAGQGALPRRRSDAVEDITSSSQPGTTNFGCPIRARDVAIIICQAGQPDWPPNAAHGSLQHRHLGPIMRPTKVLNRAIHVAKTTRSAPRSRRRRSSRCARWPPRQPRHPNLVRRSPQPKPKNNRSTRSDHREPRIVSQVRSNTGCSSPTKPPPSRRVTGRAPDACPSGTGSGRLARQSVDAKR